jgi:hypothetical protein
MPQEHIIEAFEKRDPGQPSKAAGTPPEPPQEAVQAKPKLLRIIIHTSEDGKDVEPATIPCDKGGQITFLTYERNKEIVVEPWILEVLNGCHRRVDKFTAIGNFDLDELKKRQGVPTYIKRFPYTVLGPVED